MTTTIQQALGKSGPLERRASEPFQTLSGAPTREQEVAAERLASDLRRLHRELLSRVNHICSQAAQTSVGAQELAAKPLSQLTDVVSALPALADSLDPARK